MSLIDGKKAMNLDMPARIPRTEYSLEYHYALQKRVTGIDVDETSSDEVKRKASEDLKRIWNFDFFWSVDVFTNFFGDFYTKMGHAAYAANGSDYDNVISCPFENVEQALNFEPQKQYGTTPKEELVRFFNEKYEQKCKNSPGGVNTIGTYTTFISGAIDMFGWDMFLMALGTDSEECGKMMTRYSDYMMQYYEALAETDSPYILIHDDIVWTSGAFVSPKWYREYVFPAYKRYLKPLENTGKKILYCSDGNFTEFIDDIADCGFHGFIFEPDTSLEYIAKNYGNTHVIIGNADTRILLSGTKQQISDEVKRCMEIGKSCPGFFMAVGNHIPANTPVENALYYNECYEKMSIR